MIYKYELTGRPIRLPHDSRILTAQYQGSAIFVWVELGTHPAINYRFYRVGTGWYDDTSNDSYLTTLQDKDGFVWHIFYKELE